MKKLINDPVDFVSESVAGFVAANEAIVREAAGGWFEDLERELQECSFEAALETMKKINVMGVRSRSNVREQTAEIDMELEIYNINAFNRALAKLSQLNDVISAKRL